MSSTSEFISHILKYASCFFKFERLILLAIKSNHYKNTIAITGSSGKTTTKEMLAAILKTRWRIIKTPGNSNLIKHTRHIAAARKPYHRALIAELGIAGYRQVKKHCRYIKPDIGIITNIGTAHIGNFGGQITAIARTKGELIDCLNPNGLLIINGDDPNSRLLPIDRFKGKVVRVGLTRRLDYYAYNIDDTGGGLIFSIDIRGKQERFFLPTVGRHNIYNALYAIVVADYLGFSADHIRKGLHRYRRPRSRLIVHVLKNDIRIIDDSYSSNPSAAKVAIDVLDSLPGDKKIAVLGSMLEMGKYSATGHAEVGQYLAAKKVDFLITYGEAARQIGKGAIASGFPAPKVTHVSSLKALRGRLIPLIEPRTTILLKASHKLNLHYLCRYLIKRYKKKKPIITTY
mgnify:FL=1|jgi:UDP-N-acetylmuramoyl-tripeptide--D-alanyl-D-alanine ligase